MVALYVYTCYVSMSDNIGYLDYIMTPPNSHILKVIGYVVS